jgi:L-fuculose-phosphate aldolase
MTIPSDRSLRQALVDAMNALETAGLNFGSTGNASVRTADGLLITPTGVRPSELGPTRIVKVTQEGTWRGKWRPSSEWQMHAAVYEAYSGAVAVVHTHADYCTALSCLRRGIPTFHYMMAAFGASGVRCSSYATFGTKALGDRIVRALAGRNACLIANHGMLCHAATLEKAVANAIRLEALARQYWLALAAGNPIQLDRRQMADVHLRYASYGQQKRN